jgi:hypothetical protein
LQAPAHALFAGLEAPALAGAHLEPGESGLQTRLPEGLPAQARHVIPLRRGGASRVPERAQGPEGRRPEAGPQSHEEGESQSARPAEGGAPEGHSGPAESEVGSNRIEDKCQGEKGNVHLIRDVLCRLHR